MKIACKVFDFIMIENDEDGGELTAICNTLVAAYDQGLEDAGIECIRIWRAATNERTNSALSSYRQNALGEGCTESAAAINKLKIGAGGQGED